MSGLTHSIMKLKNGMEIDFVNEAVLQHESEVQEAIDFMLERGPIKNVIEIGVWEGGTAYIWGQIVGNEGWVFAIDKHFGSETTPPFCAHVANHIPPVYRKTDAGGRVIEIQGSSEDPKVMEAVSFLLDGKKVDLLFHDGDHTYEGAKRDVENYSCFVKDGGWIALCDWMDRTHGVSHYWAELKRKYETYEFVIQRQDEKQKKSHRWLGFQNGIGLIKWRS